MSSSTFMKYSYLNRLISISIRDRVYCGDLLSHIVTVVSDCFIPDVQLILPTMAFLDTDMTMHVFFYIYI